MVESSAWVMGSRWRAEARLRDVCLVAAMRMGELTVLMAEGCVIGWQSKWASWLLAA